MQLLNSVDKDVSISGGGGGLQHHLDRAEILASTVDQLRRDLSLSEEGFAAPFAGDAAFEELRGQVILVLQGSAARGDHALNVLMYRVDISEPHMHRTMATGGFHALAGEVVLRALQKVLTRLRFAGRF